MVSAVSEELINLFECRRDDSFISDCLELITKADEVRCGVSVVLPLEQAIDIYSTRAKINKELRGGNIKGYDVLLPALSSADVAFVKLQSFELPDRRVKVFTNESVSQLFGVLTRLK